LFIHLGIISALLVLTACSNPIESNSSELDIIGTITNISSNSGQLEVLVEEDPSVSGPEKKNGKKIFFLVSEETEIYKQNKNGPRKKINSKVLKVGMKVKGWASEWVMQSYPTQAGAIKIIVIEK